MRRRLVGVVTRKRAKKTCRVEVSRMVPEATYGKYIRRRTICIAHDETDQARENDVVEIVECRPRSKLKRWELTRVLEHPELA